MLLKLLFLWKKRSPPSPSCSSFCSLYLQSLFLTQQVQIHAECSIIILIKWNHLSIFPLSFQKDLGSISSLEKVQIVHFSVFKKITTQMSIDAYSLQITLWKVRQFFPASLFILITFKNEHSKLFGPGTTS